jgi:hypothetical protein
MTKFASLYSPYIPTIYIPLVFQIKIAEEFVGHFPFNFLMEIGNLQLQPCQEFRNKSQKKIVIFKNYVATQENVPYELL